jgi:hypothetical protein
MGKTERSRLEKQLLFYTKKASHYTSQCDKGNITFMIYVIRISLVKGAGDSLENQQRKDQLSQADRPCSRFHQGSLIQCTITESLGRCLLYQAFPDKERLGLRAPLTHESTRPALI